MSDTVQVTARDLVTADGPEPAVGLTIVSYRVQSVSH